MNRILVERSLDSGQRLQIVQGDLTQERVDAIVNAANEFLQHGGGVAAAIARHGGLQIQAESDTWVREHGPVRHDAPAYTRAGNLPCRYVIHAVGPVWGEGDEEAKLAAAVAGSLGLADRLKLRSIAFPAISTGIFGFPKEAAAAVILTAIEDYCTQNLDSGLLEIRLTLFDQPTIEAFLKKWKSIRGDEGLESRG
jgi:O-acetyl-ADP-ribose deacetylase (regulator of RNase III)